MAIPVHGLQDVILGSLHLFPVYHLVSTVRLTLVGLSAISDTGPDGLRPAETAHVLHMSLPSVTTPTAGVLHDLGGLVIGNRSAFSYLMDVLASRSPRGSARLPYCSQSTEKSTVAARRWLACPGFAARQAKLAAVQGEQA